MKKNYAAALLAAALSACGGGDGDDVSVAQQAADQQTALAVQQCTGDLATCEKKVADCNANVEQCKKQPELLWILIAGPIVFPYPGTAGTGTHIVPN